MIHNWPGARETVYLTTQSQLYYAQLCQVVHPMKSYELPFSERRLLQRSWIYYNDHFVWHVQ